MPFATQDDVADRLGRALTAAEVDQVTYLLGAVGDLFSVVAGKDVTADPVAEGINALAVEKVIAAMRNQDGVIAESLGEHSVTYSRDGGGLALTQMDELLIRRAVWGRTSDSVMIGSIFEEVE